MTSWKRRQSILKAGSSATRKSSTKSKKRRPRHENADPAIQLLWRDESSRLTQRCKATKTAAKETPGPFCFLPAALCLLPTAFCLLANRNTNSPNSSHANAGPFAIALTDTAAEPASMGRGYFVSWFAFGSYSRDRPDTVRRNLVCH